MSQAASLSAPNVSDRIGSAAQGGSAPTAATRYLAAGAYLDATFRAQVLSLMDDEYRARAPEPGIDPECVVRHCRTALARKAWRDALLCAPLAYMHWTLFPLLPLLSINPDYIPVALAAYWLPIVATWFAASGIVFGESFLTEILTLTYRLSARDFEQPQPVPQNAQLDTANVVAYGAFSPFVGSGYDLAGWSFAVNLEQRMPGRETAPDAFQVTELYDALRKGFERLEIGGLKVADRLYVDGKAIRDDNRFLPATLARPVSRVTTAILAPFISSPGKTVRHYLSLEIQDWSGQLVLSTFIRLQKTQSKLFAEMSSFLLPPLKGSYYAIDGRSRSRVVGQTLGLFLSAFVQSPFLLVLAPFRTAGRIWTPVRRLSERSQKRKEIRNNPLYNYGALTSIRQLGTENTWRVYFQKLDKEMHTKIIQQQLLDVLTDFLADHGIDVSEIKERGSFILNNGVMVSGGLIQAEGLAVGQGAQAKVSKRSQ